MNLCATEVWNMNHNTISFVKYFRNSAARSKKQYFYFFWTLKVFFQKFQISIIWHDTNLALSRQPRVKHVTLTYKFSSADHYASISTTHSRALASEIARARQNHRSASQNCFVVFCEIVLKRWHVMMSRVIFLRILTCLLILRFIDYYRIVQRYLSAHMQRHVTFKNLMTAGVASKFNF